MAAQKIHASTQKFTEIVDFIESVVILDGGNACSVIEITASNFALLSKREQDSRIFSYAGLLNSLSFPIQILIRNQRMDISSYLKELDSIALSTKNERLGAYIQNYSAFVHEMVTVNVVLNKEFYIVIPYSSLEVGVKGATAQVGQKQKARNEVEQFAFNAKNALQVKVSSILVQLQKFAVSAKLLEREDLIKLFYDIYNEGVTFEVTQAQEGIDAAIVRGGENA